MDFSCSVVEAAYIDRGNNNAALLLPGSLDHVTMRLFQDNKARL